MPENGDSDTHGELLGDELADLVDILQEAAAEGRFLTFIEVCHVATTTIRAAHHTSPDDLTRERLELISRLAWAEAGLIYGYADRTPDDLEGVEELADEVQRQDKADV